MRDDVETASPSEILEIPAMLIRPLDREVLKREFESATPFPHIVIDDFLDPDFAADVSAAFPTFEEALETGFEFDFVRERRKIQISDRAHFAAPVARLDEALASQDFLNDLEHITGISGLLPDPELGGGGIHVTGSGGRLDVHVDFNFNEKMQVHRRLNILIYLNPEWNSAWGGQVELWDRDVRTCHQRVDPRLNRCILFETSNLSFHGVRPVVAEAPKPRKSFAAYYYTKDAPPDWDGRHHSTIFRARPDEHLRRFLVVPAEQVLWSARQAIRALRANWRKDD